ncbi:SGNH/GDSL hydrolase family protein [Rufibacter sp. DG15C]|uniref:SGNH/GDSL hydrolase family protein n=1 Tax=Rufibacter sp. DG15C TaxID=1379909 RepID=UPI00082F101B|nr:SGNH/GDSL hydrolase family protein [Rufibacter sp. DG15C]
MDELEDTLPGPGMAAKFLALGDSYTIGEGVLPADRWPMQLSVLLEQEGIQLGEPLYVAKTGWTTGNLLSYLRTVSMPSDYGLVTLQIGVNNQYQNRPIDEFRNELRSLLTIATGLASKTPRNVMLLTIPDWGLTPFATGKNTTTITSQINKFNTVITEEGQKAGVVVVNVNDLSKMVTSNPAFVAPDGLHYSASMYTLWAQRALPTAVAIIKE